MFGISLALRLAVQRRRKQDGMTLLEIMVVVMIIAAIASAVGVSVLNSWGSAQRRDTEARARTIQSAATAHLVEGGDCPTVSDLEKERLDPTTKHSDAWGHEFSIECDGNVIHVSSPGKDGEQGTDDDIGF